MFQLSRKTINSERQNKPTLVVRDLVGLGVEPGQVYASLLRRGVFKWLSVRRDLIKYKDTLKERITASIEKQKTLHGPSVNYERGYRKALEDVRKDLAVMCHSDRWRVPENDQKAVQWFGYYNDLMNWKVDGDFRTEKEQ